MIEKPYILAISIPPFIVAGIILEILANQLHIINLANNKGIFRYLPAAISLSINGIMLSSEGRGLLRILILSLLDSITVIPSIIYLVIIVGILGNSVFTMIIALTISIILRVTKFVMTLSQDEQKSILHLC